jgi:sugar/nucleoside kinase (ribokinase family)
MLLPMNQPRQGILAAGNFIVDFVKIIDAYPAQDTLVNILEESKANGGGPYNLLADLAAMGVTYPLYACGVVGDDENGRWIARDCAQRGINSDQLRITAQKPTSYTDAMTVRDTARRTFFHQRGANATFDRTVCDLQRTSARLFYLGYLLLLDQLDIFDATGRSEASRLLESASEAGMITAVDLVSAENPEYGNLVSAALPFTDHLLLNELEASKVLGLRIFPETADELLAAAEKILAGGVKQTVTIHTTRGAVCVSTNGETVIQPSLKLSEGYVSGSTGAGDAFAAGYLHGIHECLPLSHCLYIAVCTAAASLRHPSPSAGIDAVEDCLALGKRFGLADFH